ncbi:MAG: hypothetical protein RJR34_04365 [Candidatus Methanoculleus thermohydrogenotrophicum]|mgnify:CR=1 FL=1|jgi:hypothetical protein|nr:hypothetical protein [Candidatus Methanoculleus thermohydrogenotrophicum]
MSKRDETLLFEDILEAIGRIRECARGCSKEDFFRRGLSSPYTENLGSKPEETLFCKRSGGTRKATAVLPVHDNGAAVSRRRVRGV